MHKRKTGLVDAESIHSSVTRELAALIPREMAKAHFEKRLRDLGAKDPAASAEKLVHFMFDDARADEPFDDGTDENIELEITDDDLDAIQVACTNFMKNDLPSLLKDERKKAGQSLTRTLKRRWGDQHAYEKAQHRGFRERLEERWGKAFDLLRMVLTCSQEIGRETGLQFHRSKAKRNRHLRYVLLLLHGRACQVATSIMVLMENGLADDAMARWRTLYEIEVVAMLIAQHGDNLAERYLRHEAVEAFRVRELEAKHGVKISQKELAAHRQAVDGLKQQYGVEYANHYGWAAHHIGSNARTFEELERAVKWNQMRPDYKFASYNVHASIRGITQRLGLMGREGFLQGPSNAGFMEPGRRTARTLTHITLLLMGAKLSFDDQIAFQSLVNLRDQASRAFNAVNRKLVAEEESIRAAQSRKPT